MLPCQVRSFSSGGAATHGQDFAQGASLALYMTHEEIAQSMGSLGRPSAGQLAGGNQLHRCSHTQVNETERNHGLESEADSSQFYEQPRRARWSDAPSWKPLPPLSPASFPAGKNFLLRSDPNLPP